MLSMLVYFSSAQLAQSQAVAPPALGLLPLPHVTTVCKNRRLFTVAGDNSHVLTPIPMHLIPIPIPWLILHPFPWESHGTHGIPVFPIPMHTSSWDVSYTSCGAVRAAGWSYLIGCHNNQWRRKYAGWDRCNDRYRSSTLARSLHAQFFSPHKCFASWRCLF